MDAATTTGANPCSRALTVEFTKKSSCQDRPSLPHRVGSQQRQGRHLHHPFATKPLRLSAAEWMKRILRRHSSLFAKRWSATRRSLPVLRHRAVRRSPASTNDRPTHSPFDEPNVYRPAPSTVEWKSSPLLCAGAFGCRPSSELERFGNLDISRAFWNSAQFSAARSLLVGVAAALVLSRFATEVLLTRAIDSIPQCHRRDGKR